MNRYYRRLLLVAAVLISVFFVVVNEEVSNKFNIELNSNLGQLNNYGYYDYGDYTLQVNNLIRNGSFRKEHKVLNRYPPVYPLILFSSYKMAHFLRIDNKYTLWLFTIIFNFLSTLLLIEIILLFNPNKLYAFFSGLIFLVHPYILQSLTKVMSVTPFMTFLFFSLFLLFKGLMHGQRNIYRFLLFSGLFLGLAILTRPIGIFLPLVFIFIFLIFFKDNRKSLIRLKGSFLLIAAVVLTLLPWELFNHFNGQKILVADNDIISIRHGITFNNNPHRDKLDLNPEVEKLSLQLSFSDYKTSGEFLRLLGKKFTEDPVPVIKMFFLKAGRSWYGVYSQNQRKENIKLIVSLFFILLTTIGMYSYIRESFSHYKLLIVSFLFITLYFWMMTILVDSMVRYMIPVFGLMCLFFPGFFELIRNGHYRLRKSTQIH